MRKDGTELCLMEHCKRVGGRLSLKCLTERIHFLTDMEHALILTNRQACERKKIPLEEI